MYASRWADLGLQSLGFVGLCRDEELSLLYSFHMYLISKVLRATGGQALDTVEGQPSKTGPVAYRNINLSGHLLLSLVVIFCPFQDLVKMASAASVCSLLFSPLLFSMPVVALAESSKSPFVLPELPQRSQRDRFLF